MMLDPFAAALGDESDGKFVASARMCRDNKAHSQDSINEHKLAVIAIDDDGSDHSPVDEAAMQGAEQLVALQASERERPTAKTATPEMKRRRIDLNQRLKLTPIEEKNGSSVVCLFVPRAKVRSTAAALHNMFAFSEQWQETVRSSSESRKAQNSSGTISSKLVSKKFEKHAHFCFGLWP